MKSLFPEDIMSNSGELTMETVAAKLTYFHEQLHLLHWQTQSYAEHIAVGSLYVYVHDFKDGVIEKLMGYCGRRPKAFKIEALSDETSAEVVVGELESFAQNLVRWAGANGYADIENIAQSLSGEAAKCLYLLTLT